MSILRTLAAAALLALALPALAQNAIEQQMTAEEFKAAGLDKLSAEELGRLNAWLNRTVETATTQAATAAKKKVEDDNRGFFNFGSEEPVVSTIVGQFNGFERNRLYVLENGQHWRQTDNASLHGVQLSNPQVQISPGVFGNVWYMKVGRYNTRAKVERVK
ncbi:MAG: hypothetical protein ACR2J7_01055 [Luteimonas sp.]